MRKEIWKDIEGFEGLYQVSNDGRVRSLDRFVNSKLGAKRPLKGQIIKMFPSKFGYIRVNLWREQHMRTFQVHRLVYTAFIGPIPEGMQVNHIDEDKTNNRVENLNLMTPKENCNWGTHNQRVQETRKGFKMPEKAKSQLAKANRKPIIQMDLKGNELMGWISATDCERETNYDQGLISRVCNGVYKQAYGYKWKYAV